MSDYTVVYGKKNLVAVYCEDKLVATHDKHTKFNGDLNKWLKKLEDEGHVITERQGDFKTYTEIPQKINVTVQQPKEENSEPVRREPVNGSQSETEPVSSKAPEAPKRGRPRKVSGDPSKAGQPLGNEVPKE